MSINYRALQIIIFCVGLSGCIASQYVEDAKGAIASSPKIVLLTKESYQPRSQSPQIELFYKYWNPLTRPDAVKDWEYLFVMGEATSPKWAYSKLSDVIISQRPRDDNKAVAELREIAAKQGGDAVIDLHREPMIDAPQFGARIVGFRYFGTVVRKK